MLLQPLLLGLHLAARQEAAGLAGTAAYMAGMRANILLGGDNAGRGQWVGALLAAANGPAAVPRDWSAQVDMDAEIGRLAQLLVDKRAGAADAVPAGGGAAGIPGAPAATTTYSAAMVGYCQGPGGARDYVADKFRSRVPDIATCEGYCTAEPGCTA